MQFEVPDFVSWPAIISAFIIALGTGAWTRYSSSKLDTYRYVADSITVQFHMSDQNRRLQEIDKKLDLLLTYQRR